MLRWIRTVSMLKVRLLVLLKRWRGALLLVETGVEGFRGVDSADFDRFVLGCQQQDIFAGIVDFAEVFLVDLDHHDPELSGTPYDLLFTYASASSYPIASGGLLAQRSSTGPVDDDSWLQGDRMPL